LGSGLMRGRTLVLTTLSSLTEKERSTRAAIKKNCMFNNIKQEKCIFDHPFITTGFLNLKISFCSLMYRYYSNQCCGSICFWASWIRIHWSEIRIQILLSSSKNSKKNVDCFVNSDPDPLARGSVADP
jgi:hypothetical protein